MMAETCTEWIESTRMAAAAMDRDQKIIARLERERNRIGAVLADARKKLITAMSDITMLKAVGKSTRRIGDAPAFYEANIRRIEARVAVIDDQIIIAREEMHDIADLIVI